MKSEDFDIEFPDEGLSTGCAAEDLGGGVYKLVEHPIFSEAAQYGDIIRAEKVSDEKLIFKEVVQRNESTMFAAVLSSELVSSPKFELFKTKLTELGIFWQQDLGGVFICFIPKGFEIGIESDFDKIST